MSNQVKQYDFTLEEVQKLFAMQDTLNSYIHPEWKTQGFNWGLAIVDECMEIHGHLGWKWWKDGYQVGLTDSNLAQVQLEVIDILHFVVSQELEWDCQGTMINVTVELRDYSFADTVGFMMQSSIGPDDGPNLHQWAVMAHSIGLTKQQILETYTQKYVLNKFRQDHGYKDGTYVKEWEVNNSDGEPVLWEDNQVLENVVRWLKLGNHSTTDENTLYAELQLQYNHRRNQ